MKGKFIVFEGSDGSGKSTQIALLAERMRKNGRRVHVTAEPTSSSTGGYIREILSGGIKKDAATLAVLFFADRLDHINGRNGIRKFLEEGTDVICDRYYYSTFAYQGLGTDLKWLIDMHYNCPDIIIPSACVFLDVDADECKARMTRTRAYTEIFEENAEQIKGIRNKFLEVFPMLKSEEKIIMIDGALSREEMAEEIYSKLNL